MNYSLTDLLLNFRINTVFIHAETYTYKLYGSIITSKIVVCELSLLLLIGLVHVDPCLDGNKRYAISCCFCDIKMLQGI